MSINVLQLLFTRGNQGSKLFMAMKLEHRDHVAHEADIADPTGLAPEVARLEPVICIKG